MAKKTLQELQYEFDGLLKGAKRAEQLKGLKSKFAPVFKARGMKGLKAGGPIIIKMNGGSLKDIPAGNKGLPNLPTATRNKMGYKKAGGIVKRKASGKVIKSSTSGQDLVNSCYD